MINSAHNYSCFPIIAVEHKCLKVKTTLRHSNFSVSLRISLNIADAGSPTAESNIWILFRQKGAKTTELSKCFHVEREQAKTWKYYLMETGLPSMVFFATSNGCRSQQLKLQRFSYLPRKLKIWWHEWWLD